MLESLKLVRIIQLRFSSRKSRIIVGLSVLLLFYLFFQSKSYSKAETSDRNRSFQNNHQNHDHETHLKGIVQSLKEAVLRVDSNIKTYDLTKDLPAEWNGIPCRKSAFVQSTQTTLCVHDLASDIHVSGMIWRTGVWEMDIISSFLKYIIDNPDWLVLDFGAQIGQYSLFPASIGRKVLTVEPFLNNIKRIHKAAKAENIGANIKLIQNAITNKRNEILSLERVAANIGGQSVNYAKTYTKEEMATNEYLVETILMDDLVDQIPLNANGQRFTKAILKIDIEGSEPFAFQHAGKFFDALDIQVIFMEWGNLPKLVGKEKDVEQMIGFLMSRNFVPYNGNQPLDKSNWKSNWSWDIYWKKQV